MQLDLNNVPFTRRNSYMVVSNISDDFKMFGRKLNKKSGLYLRSVRGQCRTTPFIAHLVPTIYGKPVEYTYEATEAEIIITIRNSECKIEITFADDRTLLIRGIGEGVGISLEDLAEEYSFYDYVLQIPYKNHIYYEANLFKSGSKYILMNQLGNKELVQEWEMQTAVNCQVNFEESRGEFLAVIEEAQIEWEYREYSFDFDACVARQKQDVADYAEKMPEVPADLKKEKLLAAYINWCSQVKKEGILTRDALYPSKNWMIGAFSWDHCFIAQALSYHLPEEAWNQFMIMFDYQDETGRIPDAVTDGTITWNFCKPPVHGWTLMKMMEHMELSHEQLVQAYDRLSKWTNWWYAYRDNDNDGICEYYHGNDSGWDNATVFKDSMTIESPDLSAELVLQQETLAYLAELLDRKSEAEEWKIRAQKQLADMLVHCFQGNKPVAVDCGTNQVVECDCLLPYVAIILGNRLPKEKRDYMVKALKEEFLAPGGIATEKTSSPFYLSDGYWRGPIWAPSTMMVLDGLYQLGEKEFVKDVTRRYVDMVKKSGFPENFDSVSGDGNRDRAFSWTASTFLVIANRYLLEK